MQQYMLTVHSVEGSPEPSPEARQKVYQDVDSFNAELRTSGAWVFAGGLHSANTATVVRVRDGGEVLVTDGWVIAVPDMDGALEWAAKATMACAAPVEVRPFENVSPD